MSSAGSCRTSAKELQRFLDGTVGKRKEYRVQLRQGVAGSRVYFGWSATTVYAMVAIPAGIAALALATLGIVRRQVHDC